MSGFLEIVAEDGSVLMRLDADGVRVLGQFLPDIVRLQNEANESTIRLVGSGQKGQVSIESDNGTILLQSHSRGVSIERLGSKYLANENHNGRLDVRHVIAGSVTATHGLAEINHLILLGRSLADGRGTVRYTESRFDNLSGYGLSDRVTSFVPNTANHSRTLEQYRYIAVDHCCELLQRIKGIDLNASGVRFLTTEAAIGGTAIEQLRPLTLPLIRAQVQDCKRLAEQSGYSYRFAGCMVSHGEDVGGQLPNQPSGDLFEYHWKEYIREVREVVNQETGQHSGSVPFFILAKKGYGLASTRNEAALAHSRICRDDPFCFMVGSNHPLEPMTAEGNGADAIHISGYGTFEGGVVFGRALYRYFFANESPTGLMVERCWQDGASLFVEFNRKGVSERTISGNGYPFDSMPVNLGFYVSNKPIGTTFNAAVHIERQIVAAQIVNESTVKLTLSQPCQLGDVLTIGGSGIAKLLPATVYGEQSTDGTVFDPYEILIPHELVIPNA